MTEILTMIGIENATKVIAWVLAFISVSAITVSLVTEGLKSIKWINVSRQSLCAMWWRLASQHR